jgi:hypothetical protein
MYDSCCQAAACGLLLRRVAGLTYTNFTAFRGHEKLEDAPSGSSQNYALNLACKPAMSEFCGAGRLLGYQKLFGQRNSLFLERPGKTSFDEH